MASYDRLTAAEELCSPRRAASRTLYGFSDTCDMEDRFSNRTTLKKEMIEIRIE